MASNNSDLLSEMSSKGLVVSNVIADGECHRTPTADKKGKKNGWYFATKLSGNFFASFGNWATGEIWKYPNGNSGITLSEGDREAMAIIAAEAKRMRENTNLIAGIMAEHEYQNAKTPQASHDYLKAKGVGIHNARQGVNGELLTPIYNSDGVFSTLQRIYKNGEKKLYYKGKKKGCCSVIDGDCKDHIFVCEGWATGCTIAELTDCKVLVAIDSGNLPIVAGIARDMMPGKKIIIAADNDHKSDKNAGLQAGKKAAEVVGVDAILVYPDEINGSDFNDMFHELGDVKTRNSLTGGDEVEIVTAEEIIDSSISFNIGGVPGFPGLIGKGMDGLSMPGCSAVNIYNFAVVTAVIANALSGKITCQGVWPNIYNIKVGGSSTGKSVSDKEMKVALKNAGAKDFYGLTDIASGAGLYRALQNNPQTILAVDEISFLFRRGTKHDPVAEGKRSALLDIYSASGVEIRKAFGNSSNEIHIDQPSLTITGNATLDIFDSFTVDDISSGLIPRFDFFCFDGDIPNRGIKGSANHDLNMFAEAIVAIDNCKVGTGLQDAMGMPADIGVTNRAAEMLQDYSDSIIRRCRAIGDDGSRAIISRSYDLAIKYALIHAGAVRDIDSLTEPLDIDSLEWGIEVAKLIASWKVDILIKDKIVSGDFHRDCQMFINAIKAVVKMGQNPTFKTMANRKNKLKNWDIQHSQKVISVLQKRGEIVVDESRKITRYHVAK